MADIYTLPPELHAHIAYLACLGNTGSAVRSLSQVSKYFNTVARPYLFHTVSVTGVGRIRLLDTTLQKHVSPSGQVHVRNLYLGITQQPPSSSSERNTLLSAAHRTLVLLSTSLRTLTLDFSGALRDSSVTFARVFRISFPVLEALTLVGFYPNPTIPSRPPSPRSSLPPSPTASLHPPLFSNAINPAQLGAGEAETIERKSKFPNVKTLHLSGNRNPSGLLGVGNLAKVFPGLEELKVSGLSGAVGFAVELGDALRDPQPWRSTSSASDVLQDSSDVHGATRGDVRSTSFADMDTYPSAFAPTLPPRLRVMKVQPGPPLVQPSTGTSANLTAALKDESMMLHLISLEFGYGSTAARQAAPADAGGRVRFELVERGRVGCEEVWEAWRGGLVP